MRSYIQSQYYACYDHVATHTVEDHGTDEFLLHRSMEQHNVVLVVFTQCRCHTRARGENNGQPYECIVIVICTVSLQHRTRIAAVNRRDRNANAM